MGKSLQHGNEIAPGVTCNDRKFEVWELSDLQPAKDGTLYANKRIRVQVYAVPNNGYRGTETAGFKVVINGCSVVDSDLTELRKKAVALLRNLTEENHEKVLIVKTTGPGNGITTGEFGLTWRIGWRVEKLGIIFDQSRTTVLHDVENYDEPDAPEVMEGIRIGSKPGFRGKQYVKTAVMPWTQAREDTLRRTTKAIEQMREDLNEALLKPDAFASLLDSKAGPLMLGIAK